MRSIQYFKVACAESIQKPAHSCMISELFHPRMEEPLDLPQIVLPGLPEDLAVLLPGGLYLTQAEQPHLLKSVISHTLVARLEKGVPVLVQPHDQLLLDDAAQAAWRQGRLPVIGLRPGRPDMHRLLKELDALLPGKADLLLMVVQQSGLLDAQGRLDVKAIMQMRQWALQRQCAIWLIQQRGWQDVQQPVALNAPALLSGLVRLDSTLGPRMWRLYHWHGPAGMQTGMRWLVEGDAGDLQLKEEQQAKPKPMVAERLDEQRFYATRAVVEDMTPPPQDWQIFVDNQALLRELPMASSATFLLDYSDYRAFETLATQVQALRLHLGEGIRVVVRERKAVLRHAQMNLLRKLGCNLMIPVELPAARIQTLLEVLESLGNTPFYPGELTALLRALRPFDTRGYLPLPVFVENLESLLQAQQGQLEAALVQLNLLPGIEPQQALSAILMQRSGDVMSAERERIWLYFHGCQADQIDAALRHVVRLPLDTLFAAQVRRTDPVDMLTAVQDLRQHVERGGWTDYGPLIVGQAPVRNDENEVSIGGVFHPEPVVAAVAAPLQKKVRK